MSLSVTSAAINFDNIHRATQSVTVTGGLPPYSASSNNTNVATVVQATSPNLWADSDTLTSSTLSGLTKASGGPSGATDAEYAGNGQATTANATLSETISTTIGQSYEFSAYIDPSPIFLSSGGPILNANDKASHISLDATNLVATWDSFGGWSGIRCVLPVSSGKWYWEVAITTIGTEVDFGVALASESLSTWCGSDANGWGYDSTAKKFHNGGSVYGATFTSGDVIGIALDMNAGTITFYKNGVSQGQAFTGITGTVFPMFSASNGSQLTAKFDASTFTYSAPAGFSPLPKAFIQIADTSGNIMVRYPLTQSDLSTAKRYSTPAWTATVSSVVCSVQLTAGAKVSTGQKFKVSQPMLALSTYDPNTYIAQTSVWNVTPKNGGAATITFADSTP